MELHTPTTLLLIVMVSAVLAGALGLIGHRNAPALRLCALALGLHAFGWALIALRGQVSTLASILLAHLLLASSFATLAESVYCFQRRRVPRLRLWAPVVLITTSCSLLLHNADLRIGLNAMFYGLQAVLLLLALRPGHVAGRGQYLLALGALLVLGVATQHALPLLAGRPGVTVLTSSVSPQGLGFALLLLAVLLMALGMASMSQERMEAALRASQAYECFRSTVLDRLSEGQPLAAVLSAFVQGVEQLRPGGRCLLVLRPALAAALGSAGALPLPAAQERGPPWVLADEDGPDGPADRFIAQAAAAGLGRCRRQPVRAPDRQAIGELVVCTRHATAADVALAEELATLAGLAIERCAGAQRLRDSERQYRELIESANEGICVLQDGQVRYVNPKVRQMVGYTEAELLGRPFLEFVHYADRALVAQNHDRRLQGRAENLRYAARLLTREHGARWFELSGVALDWQGRPATLNFLTDITERRREDELVHELAYHDTLTGLANRRLLLDHLELALAANRRHGRHGALLFLDLDHFKPLNDLHGHHVGDLLLVEVARRLRHCVRELDTVARFGGDEFVVLLNGLADDRPTAQHQAEGVAEKARQALAEPYVLQLEHAGVRAAVQHQCSASVGVLLFNGAVEQQDAAEALIELADAAMYQAKQCGGNRVRFGPPLPA